MISSLIPLSLYIHIPWCIKKCPYCDFNSHAKKEDLPEKAYVDQLMLDLQTQLSWVSNRKIKSIFIGGGTPSLFSPAAYVALFSRLQDHLSFDNNVEITLEANPGAVDASRFQGYFDAGINRISIGVQSFQQDKLKILGRIHESHHAKEAVTFAQKAGFEKINIDLMFGLPNQTIKDALFDLRTAINLNVPHISWYQLTLEPNTYFYRFPPQLPNDDAKFNIQESGLAYLAANGFLQYEISAFAKKDFYCAHNINYWQFGDYLGIGAGAHAKLSAFYHNSNTLKIIRRMSLKNPKEYLSTTAETIATYHEIAKDQLPLEFMMNALRLFQPVSLSLFENRTGLSRTSIADKIANAEKQGLLRIEEGCLVTTAQGKLFLNELLESF